MAESVACCAHCGKDGTNFKRCSTCKHTWYCGKECQHAGWKTHKKNCKLLRDVSALEMWDKVKEAQEAGDWRGVLKWEECMDKLMIGLDWDMQESFLAVS